MKKNIFFVIIYALALIISFVNVGITIKDNLFSDINELPTGEYAYSVTSPDGSRVLNIYTVKNALGSAARGEIVENGAAKNIFWQTNTRAVVSFWENNEVVNIHEVSINLTHGAVYDCRRGISLFQEGNLSGKAAPEIIEYLEENK